MYPCTNSFIVVLFPICDLMSTENNSRAILFFSKKMASFYSSNTSIHACASDLTLLRDTVHLKSTCFYLWITYVIELLMDMLCRTSKRKMMNLTLSIKF